MPLKCFDFKIRAKCLTLIGVLSTLSAHTCQQMQIWTGRTHKTEAESETENPPFLTPQIQIKHKTEAESDLL